MRCQENGDENSVRNAIKIASVLSGKSGVEKVQSFTAKSSYCKILARTRDFVRKSTLYTALLSICVLGGNPFCLAEDLSFSHARDLLHERNNALKAAAANVESKKMASDSLKLLHGPTISVGAAEIWGEVKIDVDRSLSTPLGPMPIDIKDRYNFSGPRAAVTGTVPIFTGGRIGSIQKTAKFAVDEAEASRNSEINSLEAELVSKYFGLQLALSLQKLRDATLREEDQEFKRSQKFEQEGMISHVELMGVKVARDTAERESLKARNNVRTAKLELQRLLLSDNLGHLSTPLFVLRDSISPMENWVAQAMKNNPQLASIDAKVKQADQGVEASKSAWFPQVLGFGQYFFVKPHQSYLKPEWLAGIGVNFTLWDSKDRLASFKSARAALREARSVQQDTMNIVRTAAETAWINTQNAREQYNLTASNVALARDNLALKKEGFGEGLYTALDVTQARDQLLAAEVERRVSAYEFVVNYALLHVISGTMQDFMKSYNKKDIILEN